MTVPLHQGMVPLFWHKTAFHLKLITDMCTQHERTPKSRIYTDDFPRSGRSKYFAYFGNYVLFLDQPVVSLSLYNRANQWLLQPAPTRMGQINNIGPSHLKMEVRNCQEKLVISHFSWICFQITHLYTKLTIFFIRRLLKEDVTSPIVFNLWKVEKIIQHRLMPV